MYALSLTALLTTPAFAQLSPLDDNAMSEITGGALFTAQKTAGENSAGNNNLTFYRMMLDADVAFNANIDKMQLGCGGTNNSVVNNVCDIDMDYVRFMGRGSGQPGAPGAAASPGVNSDFQLSRPFVEFAIRNDGGGSTREVVGWRLGAQNVNGYMSVGQFTDPGNTSTRAPGCTNTNGAISIGCHPAGINRISGYMNVHMQGDAYGCTYLFGSCTPNSDPNQQMHLGSFDTNKEVVGTRLDRAILNDVPVNSFIGITLNADINEHLRFMHGFDLNDTSNFFMSFQKDGNVKYPSFSSGGGYNGTNYMYPANTGWWMNVPNAEMAGLKSYGQKVSLLGSLFGLTMTDIDMGQRPAKNCFGTAEFC